MAKLPKTAPTYTVSNTLRKDKNNIVSAGNYRANEIKGIDTALAGLGDTFDTKKSAYYQQAYNALRNTYVNRGRSSMQNAISSAAANTGGYGNSYGTTAGSQAFQEQLNNLSAQIPSLYSSAETVYHNQKSDLLNQRGSYLTERQGKVDSANNIASFDQTNDFNSYTARNNAYQNWLSAYLTKISK